MSSDSACEVCDGDLSRDPGARFCSYECAGIEETMRRHRLAPEEQRPLWITDAERGG